MILFSQAMISGITLGSLYALVGIGFVIIYKATGVVNFAQGEMMMLGAIFALFFHVDAGLSYVYCVVAAVFLAALIGVLLEMVVYRPLFNAPETTIILATVAVAQIMRAGVRVCRGQEVSRFPPLLPVTPINIGGVTVTPLGIGIVAIALLLVVCLSLFFSRTWLGKAMKATSENQIASAIVGINVPLNYTLIWGLSSGLAAVAGILLAPLIIITPDMGSIGIKGFIGAILGGFQSIPGAVFGGILLGVIENLGGVYLSSSMKDVIAFAVLVIVLAVKPNGLFGKIQWRKA